MNMPNNSDVPVGLHQPEKLLPATKPVTFLPSRQTSGRLASHYEELPNLRPSPRCSCTSLGYRWDMGEAHTTWMSARNTSLQQRSSLTAAQHCCPSRPPFSAMSALHRVQAWCFISRKRDDGATSGEAWDQAEESKSQTQSTKLWISNPHLNTSLTPTNTIPHRQHIFTQTYSEKWSNTSNTCPRKKLTQRTGPSFFLALFVKVICNQSNPG